MMENWLSLVSGSKINYSPILSFVISYEDFLGTEDSKSFFLIFFFRAVRSSPVFGPRLFVPFSTLGLHILAKGSHAGRSPAPHPQPPPLPCLNLLFTFAFFPQCLSYLIFGPALLQNSAAANFTWFLLCSFSQQDHSLETGFVRISGDFCVIPRLVNTFWSLDWLLVGALV